MGGWGLGSGLSITGEVSSKRWGVGNGLSIAGEVSCGRLGCWERSEYCRRGERWEVGVLGAV